MHFTNGLEFYIKNSALKKCCLELKTKLRGLRRNESLVTGKIDDQLGEDLEPETDEASREKSIDMD